MRKALGRYLKILHTAIHCKYLVLDVALAHAEAVLVELVSASRSKSCIWSEVSYFQLFEIFFSDARRTSCAPVAAPVGQHLTERMLRPPTWRAVTPLADPENPPKAMEGVQS